MRGIAKNGTHGTEFHYRSPNTDVLGWLIWRVTGKAPDVVLQEKIWSQLGAEGDAYMALDRAGIVRVGQWKETLNDGWGRQKVTAYSVRNQAEWKTAGTALLRNEIDRATREEKDAALYGGAHQA